jgi:hypothetical protein
MAGLRRLSERSQSHAANVVLRASASRGHRRRLLVAIAKLREDSGPQMAGPTNHPQASTFTGEKLDPEELRSPLHVYRTLCGNVITRYDGFVARYVGDGILTYFGWPYGARRRRRARRAGGAGDRPHRRADVIHRGSWTTYRRTNAASDYEQWIFGFLGKG